MKGKSLQEIIEKLDKDYGVSAKIKQWVTSEGFNKMWLTIRSAGKATAFVKEKGRTFVCVHYASLLHPLKTKLQPRRLKLCHNTTHYQLIPLQLCLLE